AALAFCNARRLTAAATQIVELRAADFALAHDLHRVDERAPDREYALDAFAVGDLADGEALVEPLALAGDAHAFEGLQALAPLGLLGLLVESFVDDLHIDLQRVARAEFRPLLGVQRLDLLKLELFQKVHMRNSGNLVGRGKGR